MEAACQRLHQGDTSSLIDIVNCIDSRKSHETCRLGPQALTALINILLNEGAELRRSSKGEYPLPSAEAFFALRVLSQLAIRHSDDGYEVQRALLVLGMRRCRELCLDAYFNLTRGQRYHVVAFVKVLLILYGCSPEDLLKKESSLNILAGSLDTPVPTIRTSPRPTGAVGAEELTNAALLHSGRGASPSALVNAVAPRGGGAGTRSPGRAAHSSRSPPPASAQPSSGRRANIQNRSTALITIPGTSFDLPLRTSRRFRDLPKKPLNAPFAVNPLYDAGAAGGTKGGGGGARPCPTPPDTQSPPPAAPPLGTPALREGLETAIPAQFPTPVVLFSSYYGLGCVPRLPKTEDLSTFNAWRQQRSLGTAAMHTPPVPQQPRSGSETPVVDSSGDGSGWSPARLAAVTAQWTSTVSEVEPPAFQARNERAYVATNTATLIYHQQCLHSSVLQQYLEHGKLLSWGAAAKGALGPLRQRRVDLETAARATSPQRQRGSGPAPAPSGTNRTGLVTSSEGKPPSRSTSASPAAPSRGSREVGLTTVPTSATAGTTDNRAHSPSYAGRSARKSLSSGGTYVYLPLSVHTSMRMATIACGHSVTYMVTVDGALYSCGRGENGQLGIGDRGLRYKENGTSRLQRVSLKEGEVVTRVATGTACAVALCGDRALYCWGHNVYGQCLKMPDATRVLTPVRLKTSAFKVLDICFGQFFGVLLFDDGIMGTWGIASMLGCAVGDTALEESLAPDQCKCARQVVHLELGSATPVAAVRAGPWHALAISARGEVYTWGVGRDGRLGHGTDSAEMKPRLVEGLQSCFVIDASCAISHTAVLTSTGTVYTFGDNAEGQLGLRGCAPRRLPMPLTLPGKAVAVSCGRDHTCVLLEDGDVVACGSFRMMGIGLGYGTRLCAPVRILTNYMTLTLGCGHLHSLAGVLHRRTAVMMVGNSSIDEVSRISSVVVRNGVRVAASGVGFLLVLSENNSLTSIGRGERGQLGIGDCMRPANKDDVTVSPTFTAVQLPSGVVVQHLRCGPDYVLAIDQDGVVYGWGSNEHQKLCQRRETARVYSPVRLHGYGNECVVQVACGGSFALALTAAGEVLAHGEAAYCGLGVGSSPSAPDVPQPTRVTGLHNIVAIAAGRRHAIAMTASCNVFAWGLGAMGSGPIGASGLTTTPVRVALSQNLRRIGCGPHNAFAITEEGELWVWGVNRFGECSLPAAPSAAAAAGRTYDAANIIDTPISVARQVRDAEFTAQFGLVVFEDGQVRVSGRLRYGGHRFRLSSFHSGPQPAFTVDVNAPLPRSSQGEGKGNSKSSAATAASFTAENSVDTPPADVTTTTSPSTSPHHQLSHTVELEEQEEEGQEEEESELSSAASDGSFGPMPRFDASRSLTSVAAAASGGLTNASAAARRIVSPSVSDGRAGLTVSVPTLPQVKGPYVPIHTRISGRPSLETRRSSGQVLSPDSRVLEASPGSSQTLEVLSSSPPSLTQLLQGTSMPLPEISVVAVSSGDSAAEGELEGDDLYHDVPRSPAEVAVHAGRNFPEAEETALTVTPPLLPVPPSPSEEREGRRFSGGRLRRGVLKTNTATPNIPSTSDAGETATAKDESAALLTKAIAAAAVETDGIVGLRCFPGWELICTVVEKRRPTTTEVRMGQDGLQMLLHQTRAAK